MSCATTARNWPSATRRGIWCGSAWRSAKWAIARARCTRSPVRKVGARPGVLLGGWLFAVPKSAKNSELAWKSMDWLNSEINDYTIARRFELTPRYKANWAKDPFRSDSYDQALVKIARYGRRLPINLGLNGVLDSLGFAIQKALHGEATPEQALLEAERLAQKAIDEAAK